MKGTEPSTSHREGVSAATAEDAADQQVQQLARQGLRLTLASLVCIALGLFGLLGGWESILRRNTSSAYFGAAIEEEEGAQKPWLEWPANLAYFVPLAIPLATFGVIARWTGEKAFRHAV